MVGCESRKNLVEVFRRQAESMVQASVPNWAALPKWCAKSILLRLKRLRPLRTESRSRIPLPTACSPYTNNLARACTQHERSEEHTSELQSQSNLVCRLLL